MKLWEKCLVAFLVVAFVGSIAWAAGSFYWKDTFTALDGVADSSGDRGLVIDTSGLTSFYYNGGAGWTIGDLTGGVPVLSKSSAYTVGTTNAVEGYGSVFFVTAAAVITLPTAVGGMSTCVYSTTANTVSVKANTGDIIWLDGVTTDAGDKISSASAVGDFVCVIAVDATNWRTLGRSGAWTDTGA